MLNNSNGRLTAAWGAAAGDRTKPTPIGGGGGGGGGCCCGGVLGGPAAAAAAAAADDVDGGGVEASDVSEGADWPSVALRMRSRFDASPPPGGRNRSVVTEFSFYPVSLPSGLAS